MSTNNLLLLVTAAAALPSPALQDLTDAAELKLFKRPSLKLEEGEGTKLYVNVPRSYPPTPRQPAREYPDTEAQTWLRSLTAQQRAELEARARILKAKALIHAATEA